MKCILCDKDYKINSETSYLRLPTYRCNNCDLVVTGNNELEIREKTEKIYKQKHWGEGNLWYAKKAIDSNYTDNDSLGKKRSWISQYKYCKQYLENRKTILEIGSGQGQASWWFEQEGFMVTGIEPDLKNVELINMKLKNGRCIQGSGENFSIYEKFDLIWMSHVLEHLINPNYFFSRIKNNMKDGGIFFIEVPNCENLSVLKTSIELVPHTFHFSKKSLEKLAKQNLFQVIKSDYFRPASKIEGIKQKISKEFPYYPRIECKNSDGTDLRMILRLGGK